MKRYLFVTILLVAALACSCTVEEEPINDDSTITIVGDENPGEDDSIVDDTRMSVADFAIENDAPDTKTILTFLEKGVRFTFVDGERLGIFPYTVENAPQMPFFLNSIDATTFSLKCPGFALKDGVDYGAYYPYYPSYDITATSVPVNYTGQTQSSVDGSTFNISSADYLIANATPSGGGCFFKMSHIGSLVVIDATAPESNTYTELSLNSSSASFVTSGTINVGQSITLPSDGTPAQGIEIANTATSDKISLTLGSDSGLDLTANQTYRFCIMVAPVDLSSSTVTLKLKTSSGAEYSTILTSKNFRQGYAYRYNCTF